MGHHRQKRKGGRSNAEKNRQSFINTVKKWGRWRGRETSLADLR